MRILHLDVPRGLSLTLREWSWSCAALLADDDGKGWRQVDLNFDFWAWVLDDEHTGLFGRVTDLHLASSAGATDTLRECEAAVRRMATQLGCNLDLRGLRFPASVAASPDSLRDYARRTRSLDPYFRRVCAKYMLLSGYSIISLGIDSADALVFGALLADFVQRHDPDIRVVLSRHQYENYSLVHRLPELTELLSTFDAVVHYEEQLAVALRGLVRFWRHGDASQLGNVLVETSTVPTRFSTHDASEPSGRLVIDPQYVRDTGVPPDRLVYFAPVIRNACYYGRCTFCVQNERYLVPQAHKYERELARSMEALESLAALGVTAYSFSDQALHPRAVEALCRRLTQTPLKIQWCGRMLAEPDVLDDTLLARMREAGCREILFGLESVRRDTLLAMDKDVCGDEATIRELAERAERHGIDVVFSMMFGFPAESDDEFERMSLPFIEQMRSRKNVTVIVNRFALFRDTPMERSPHKFGIATLAEPTGPLAITRDFVDVHGRSTTQAHPREQIYRTPDAGHHVAYTSVGLQYRWRTGYYLGESSISGGDERDVLVLGCNSYVGQNLVRELDPRRLVLSSRGTRCDIAASVAAPYLRADLTTSTTSFVGVSPREVYVVSRPTSDFAEQSRFAAELKNLLHGWSRQRLERVVLLSTQLVYATPRDGAPLRTTTPLAPVAPYEYFKVELEGFLGHLANTSAVSADIFRLPLVFGGTITHDQRKSQLLYQWCDYLMQGARWHFADDAERTFGNSWVWMPDLVDALRRRGALRVSIRQPVSGAFTYAELQDTLAPFAAPGSSQTLRLIRSKFLLADEENLPQRDLMELVARALVSGPSPRPHLRLPLAPSNVW